MKNKSLDDMKIAIPAVARAHVKGIRVTANFSHVDLYPTNGGLVMDLSIENLRVFAFDVRVQCV